MYSSIDLSIDLSLSLSLSRSLDLSLSLSLSLSTIGPRWRMNSSDTNACVVVHHRSRTSLIPVPDVPIR